MTHHDTESEEQQADTAVQRGAERRNFFLLTSLRSEAHGPINARVRNVSEGGMMVEFEVEPDPQMERGLALIAELRGIGRVRGRVAWTNGRRLGVAFDRPVDPELARKPMSAGDATPAYVKPVLVPGRSLKYVEGL